MSFGPWILKAFGVLKKFKFLRGTPFDPFGYTEERRTERKLIADYEALLKTLIAELTPANHAAAVALASLPEKIRGFGPVKHAQSEGRQGRGIGPLRAVSALRHSRFLRQPSRLILRLRPFSVRCKGLTRLLGCFHIEQTSPPGQGRRGVRARMPWRGHSGRNRLWRPTPPLRRIRFPSC